VARPAVTAPRPATPAPGGRTRRPGCARSTGSATTRATDKRCFTLVSKIPAISPTLTLFSAKYLVKTQSAYRLINNLKMVQPVLTLLLLALGVSVTRAAAHARDQHPAKAF
jgi:hypothetical protein